MKKRKVIKIVVSMLLVVLTAFSSVSVVGAATIDQVVSGTSKTVTTIGYTSRRVYWGAYNGGVYHLNANSSPSASFPLTDPGVAFCFENNVTAPTAWDARSSYNATLTEYTGKNKEYIIRALYYGWNGPGNIFGSTESSKGYLITRAVASLYYSGYGDSVYKADTTLYNLVKKSTVNPAKFKFSSTQLQFQLVPKTDASGNTVYYQKSNTIQLLSADDYANSNNKIDKNSYVEITVPTPKDSSSTLYLVNDTKGKEYKSGTTTKIYGGDKFHFTIRGGNTETISFSQSCTINVKGIFIASSGSYQTLGRAFYTTDKQTLSFTISPPSVKLQLQKTPSDTTIVSGNDCYSLAGAIYNIYLDEACTTPFVVNGNNAYIRTNATGFGKYGAGSDGVNVPLQTYYAKEVTASPGYELDPDVRKVTNSGETTSDGVPIYSFKSEEPPKDDPVRILLKKTDEDGEPLAGAEFEITYYKGFYNSQSELAGATKDRSWIFRTDSNGYVYLDPNYRVSGDKIYVNKKTGEYTFPLGTITIVETKAPDGYEIDKTNNFFIRQITGEEETEGVTTYNTITNPSSLEPSILTSAKDKTYDSNTAYVSQTSTIVDTVSYSGLKASKEYTVKGKLMDKSTGEELLINGNPVTSEKAFIPTESNGTVDVEFTFDTTALVGKSVVVFEDLYLNGDNGDELEASHADINDIGQTLTYKEPEIKTAVKDVYTGINEGYMDEVSEWVEFDDTVSYSNLITGGKYVVRGVLMDKSTGEELLVDGASVTGEKEFVPTTSSGEVEVRYSLKGTDVLGKSVVVYETLYYQTSDGTEIEIASHEDINDEKQTYYIRNPKITTSARDSLTNSNKAFVTAKDTTITDTVTYSDVIPGYSYSVTGWLVDKETGKRFSEDKEMVFTPTESSGSVDMTFTFDSTGLEGKSLVVFESFDLTFDDGSFQFVTSHMDLEDENQTITFYEPSVSTSAKDSYIGSNVTYTSEDTEIVDAVTCKGLVPGVEYTLKGVVMDKESDTVLTVQDNEVIAETKFTPADTDGEAEVKFTFDSTGLEGKELVVFEYLSIDGEVIAQHCDLYDSEQTVTFNEPTISTIAKDRSTGGNSAFPSATSTIIDTVSYSGLIPNIEYRLHGILMDKETGEELLIQGKTITAEKVFTPTESSGKEAMSFTLDSTDLKDKSVVVYEYLEIVNENEGNREISTHTDINDSNQTITYKDQSLITAARDSVTETNKGYISGGSIIIDKISYSGLIPDESYTMETKVVDKESGNVISKTVSTNFTPTEANGELEVSISIDSTPYKGKSVVVYEALRYHGSIIATHEDINDPNQTIDYLNPSLETTAIDKDTNSHEGYSSEETTIVDTVDIKGLIIGKEYKVSGVLMDKSTNAEFLVNGKTVTAEATFTAVSENQKIDLEFTFDSSALGNLTVVAFETLSYKYTSSNNSEKYTTVAAHKDINDEGQTVTIFGEGDVKFIKVDQNDNPLSGVSFEIYTDEACTTLATDADGNVINTFITDETGIVEFNDLLYGTYYIAETETVNGYMLLNDIIVADVSKNGTTLTCKGDPLETMIITNADGSTEEISKVTNTPQPNLPTTGSTGIWMMVVGGILLVGIGSVVFISGRKKKEGAEI